MVNRSFKKKPQSNLKKGNKRTRKLINKATKVLTTSELNNLDYPYLDYYTSLQDIKTNVKLLSNKFKPITLNQKPTTLLNIDLIPFTNLDGKKENIVFKENYKKYKKYYNITDYFSNRCRAICVFKIPKKTEQLSPYQFYQNNKTRIHTLLKKQQGKVSYHNLREYIYRHNKECSNFNTTVVVSILKLFKPKHWLDFSAGWGDRLIGAIAYGKCKYTGVDPSECMNPKYHNMIKTLVPKKERPNYKIIQSGFETLSSKEIPNLAYDLIFTSPPFFDLEVYEKKEKQSIHQYNSLQKWLDGFLYPTLKTCYRALEVNGKLALYISDFYDVKYTDTMKNWIKVNLPNFKYTGNIYWWNENNPKVVRTIFTWRKIS